MDMVWHVMIQMLKCGGNIMEEMRRYKLKAVTWFVDEKCDLNNYTEVYNRLYLHWRSYILLNWPVEDTGGKKQVAILLVTAVCNPHMRIPSFKISESACYAKVSINHVQLINELMIVM